MSNNFVVGYAVGTAMRNSENKKGYCLGVEKNFDSLTATVEQKQEYAECVGLLHPNEMTGSEILAWKIIIFAGLGSAIFAFWRFKDDLIEAVIFSLVALLGVPIVLMLIGLGIKVIHWAVTA